MHVCVIEGKRVQDHARLKVLAFRKREGEDWNSDDQEINKMFKASDGSSGYIFAQDFYVRDPSLISRIQTSALIYLCIKNSGVSEFGVTDDYMVWQQPKESVPRVVMTKSQLCNPNGSIDTYVLSNIADNLEGIYKDGEKIYISAAGKVVGPFKCRRKLSSKAMELEPAIGKNVLVWNYGQVNIAFDEQEHCYLLESPLETEGQRYVCYTPLQLLKWLNDRVEVEFKLSKHQRKVFDDVFCKASSEEDKLIAELISRQLSRIDLPFEILSKLATTDDAFQDMIRRQIEHFIQHLSEKAHVAQVDFESKKAQYDEIISQAEKKCTDLGGKLKEFQKTKQIKEAEQASLVGQLSRLQKDLEEKIEFERELAYEESEEQARIFLKSFAIEIIHRKEQSFTGDQFSLMHSLAHAFIQCCAEAYGKEYAKRGPSIVDLCSSFQNSRILLCENQTLPRLFGKVLGRTRVFWQIVPATWIDYDTFDKSVFSDVLKECRLYPEESVFLVLDQFNMSPPSCYLKPLTAVCVGATRNLPRKDYGWPQNLWVFCIKGKVSKLDACLPVSLFSVSGSAYLEAPDEQMGDLMPIDYKVLPCFLPSAFPPPAPFKDANLKSICDD